MSVDGTEVTEVKVEELRKAVLEMETKAAVKADEETKKVEGPAPKAKKAEEPLPPELPENVKRTQGIIAAIHQRREDRARLVSDKLRRGLEVERADREGLATVNEKINELEMELQRKVDALKADYAHGVSQRRMELDARTVEISKLDKSLEQLRKQLEAELGKLDPERKVGA